MIQICRLGRTHITVQGHAESGPYGHDLICAAVSALTIGLAVNVAEEDDPVLCLEPGDAEISCGFRPGIAVIFDAFWKAFACMAELYPEEVMVS